MEPPPRLQPPVIPTPRGLGSFVRPAADESAATLSGKLRLKLGDVLPRVPSEFIRPGLHDLARFIEFDAAELGPGMLRGRVEVPLPHIASQCANVFFVTADSAHSTLVRLPLQKLVDQSPIGPVPPLTTTEPPLTTTEPPLTTADREPEPPPVAIRADPATPFMAELRPVILGGSPPKPISETPTPTAPPLQLTQVTLPKVRPVVFAIPQPKIPPPPFEPAAKPARPEATPDTPTPTHPQSPSVFAKLQPVFMTEDDLDLTAIARLCATLPGVRACHIATSSDIAENGDFPPGFVPAALRGNAPGLTAAASRVTIGTVENVTVHTGGSALSVFNRGSALLAIALGPRGFVPGVRERLAQVVELLADTQ